MSRASLATINAIESDSLIDRATFIGNAIAQGLRTNFSDEASIVDIRNKGLMIGIELDRPCVSIVDHALEAGLLLNVTADSVIRLLPPLILDDEQIKFLIVRLTTVINKFLEESK